MHYAEHVAQLVYNMLPWSGLCTAACMHMHPTPPASTLESSTRGGQGQGKEGVGRGQLVLVSIDSALQVGAPLFRKLEGVEEEVPMMVEGREVVQGNSIIVAVVGARAVRVEAQDQGTVPTHMHTVTVTVVRTLKRKLSILLGDQGCGEFALDTHRTTLSSKYQLSAMTLLTCSLSVECTVIAAAKRAGVDVWVPGLQSLPSVLCTSAHLISTADRLLLSRNR